MNWYGWKILIALVGLLWLSSFLSQSAALTKKEKNKEVKKTLTNCFDETITLLPDNFYGVKKNGIGNLQKNTEGGRTCLIFLQRDVNKQKRLWKFWPQVENTSSGWQLYLPKRFSKKNVMISLLSGNCSSSSSVPPESASNYCQKIQINPKPCAKAEYDENACSDNVYQDKYTIRMSTKTCINCNNPRKEPDEVLTVDLDDVPEFEEGKTDAAAAVKLMEKMGNLVSSMNGTSAALSVGEATGVLVKVEDEIEVEQVSLAYESLADSIKIIEDEDILNTFSRSITVSKEAFEKAVKYNITIPYAAVLRFMNMTSDENNSTVLFNEVLAIDMGAGIKNLTDKININFKNIKYEGTAACHSWDGEGSKPNWTTEGCETKEGDKNIKCQCSHLTFFAVLLTPLNETISSSDLTSLTVITQTGCGLSMFFLSIVLFMHFLIRKTKAREGTKIFIHLVLAMFLLNFTFLINNYVAKLKNSIVCKIMAASMHYFMLATFSWFAVQAFHLCLQLYKGGIVIRHYILVVSVTSWILPSIIGIALLASGKYGEQSIYTDNPEDNVAMCWITDNNIHYIVNIGYYMLVFLFTFTTLIITMSWLICLKRTNAVDKQNKNGGSISVILGLCCLLGITWGFAFFAYGSFRIPAYYIFTVLNSFQGFFLFIYYYRTSSLVEINDGATSGDSKSTSSTCTLKTSMETFQNPYPSFQKKQ